MNKYSLDAAEIDRRFDLHTGETMSHVRSDFKRLAVIMSTQLPTSRETSLAFTKLEEALSHAISALARDGK